MPPTHDVDFVIREADADAAARAFRARGMRVEIPPEGWLIKAYDDGRMIALIVQLSGHLDMQAVLGRAEEINVAAVPMPVLTATDLVIAWLASFSEHHADFAGALSCVRPLREQVDWSRVRAEAAGSAFATAFLMLLRELRILTSEEEEDEEDAYVAGQIERAVQGDPRTHELGVRVEADGDDVVLRGQVASEERRQLVARIAGNKHQG